MDPGELDVFRNGAGEDAAAVGDGVALELLAPLQERADDDRVLLRHLGGPLQAGGEVLGGIAHVHRRARQDVGRPHQHGEADFTDEAVDVGPGGHRLPAGLVDAQAVHHFGELAAVLGPVDIGRRGAQDADSRLR